VPISCHFADCIALQVTSLTRVSSAVASIIHVATSIRCAYDVTAQIRKFENLETDEERIKSGREVYDQFIMKELLAQSHVSHFIVFFLCTSRLKNLIDQFGRNLKF